MTVPAPILVAVCGNAEAGDDALGPLVAVALRSLAPPNVEVLNLGLRPAALLDHLAGRHALLLVDAVQLSGVPAGRIIECDWSAAIPLSLRERVAASPPPGEGVPPPLPPGEGRGEGVLPSLPPGPPDTGWDVGVSYAVKRVTLNVKRCPLPVTRSTPPASTHGLSLSDQVELARNLGLLPPVVRFLGVTLGAARLGRPPSAAIRRQAPILARRIVRWCRTIRTVD